MIPKTQTQKGFDGYKDHVTPNQAKLLLSKFPWTVGFLTQDDRDKIRLLVALNKLSKTDASIFIQDIFTMGQPVDTDDRRPAAVAEVQRILRSYQVVEDTNNEAMDLSQTCSRCLEKVTDWYEYDADIICGNCRDQMLAKIEAKSKIFTDK